MLNDRTYRITLHKSGAVQVQWFGSDSVDSELATNYACGDDLPNWVQERLATLMMIPTTKPIPDIPGVGRRITENIFWVYAPE